MRERERERRIKKRDNKARDTKKINSYVISIDNNLQFKYFVQSAKQALLFSVLLTYPKRPKQKEDRQKENHKHKS